MITDTKYKEPEYSELEFLLSLGDKLNAKEYEFLLRRGRCNGETIAESARNIGIREDYARKIAHRLRKKIIYILGLNKR